VSSELLTSWQVRIAETRFAQGTHPGKQQPPDGDEPVPIFCDVALEGDKTSITTLSNLAGKCRTQNTEKNKRVFLFPDNVLKGLHDKTMQFLVSLGSTENPSHKGTHESMKEKNAEQIINLLGSRHHR
jgi:hypothetical protein